MAYVVPRRTGAWEIRESFFTDAGPRSRTLAGFQTLTPEVLERAGRRAVKPLDVDSLRRAAARVGAPVAVREADAAAVRLLRCLDEGSRPRPALDSLLRQALTGTDDRATSNARAAAAWIGVNPQRRGETLVQLLRVVDALPKPVRRRASREPFPRLGTASP